jgi:hypothetical protein
VGDFAELIIFLAVVVISLLAGGKKRRQQQRPGARRPQPRPVRQPTDLAPTPQGIAGTPTRDSLTREILQLLGAEVEEESAPPPPTPPPPEPVALDSYRRDAVSLERSPEQARALDSVDLSRKQEHDEFHDRYVDARPEQRARRASRYHRVTPRTAREAVIWKTIFSPPKALE